MGEPYFNVAFTRSFSIPDGIGEAADLQLVASRLFTQVPSEAVIEDDTDESDSNYVASSRITSWSSGSADNEKVLSYSAITDPNPHDIGHETYYEVINYQLATGAPESYAVRPFTIKRPHSLQSRLYVAAGDITGVEWKVGDVRTDAQLVTAIGEAEEQFIFRLRRHQWERWRVMEGDYNRAFRLYCLWQICRSLSDSPDDIWWEKAKAYREDYEEAYSNDPIHEDVNDDQHFSDAEIQTSTVVYFTR